MTLIGRSVVSANETAVGVRSVCLFLFEVLSESVWMSGVAMGKCSARKRTPSSTIRWHCRCGILTRDSNDSSASVAEKVAEAAVKQVTGAFPSIGSSGQLDGKEAVAGTPETTGSGDRARLRTHDEFKGDDGGGGSGSGWQTAASADSSPLARELARDLREGSEQEASAAVTLGEDDAGAAELAAVGSGSDWNEAAATCVDVDAEAGRGHPDPESATLEGTHEEEEEELFVCASASAAIRTAA